MNAARHVLWQATITSRHGVDIATELGDAHEANPLAHKSPTRSFTTMPEADQVADLLNNEIGRTIGQQNPDASMKDIALKMLDEFYLRGLYTVTKDPSGNFTVQKTHITMPQYNYMKTLYNSKLSEHGKCVNEKDC